MLNFKKCACLLLCAVLCAAFLPVQSLAAAEDACIHLADGTNAGAQNYYYNWATPIQSYLTVTSDGGLMRFQASDGCGQYTVEYYDAAYQLQRYVNVEEELPLFGGFYATDSNYYVLSGQTNRQESNEVECFRITKYDLAWNRIAFVGRASCNTTIPFYAGSARFAQSGKYLLIRTSHEMYKSDDGRNHQANVTMQVDTETMEITCDFTGIMNKAYGYVSHSFNQFIQVENDHIVAVDHGDAHPRSIVLIEYPTKVSSGWFFSAACMSADLVTFPGQSGENYTGATVGGFEISDSSYLVAYNSVAQDASYYTNKTKNLYISSVNKSTHQVTNKQITHLAEGEGTTSTPHLVKLSGNEFLLLWTQEDTVCYAKLNGAGDMISKVYTFERAALSDCVPVRAGGKLVWYVWSSSEITFYDIDLNDLSQTGSTTRNRMEILSYPEGPGGECTVGCAVCGHTHSFDTLWRLDMLWNTDGGVSYSGPLWPTVYDESVTLYFRSYQAYQLYSDLTVSVTNLNNGQTLEKGIEGVRVLLDSPYSGRLSIEKPGRYEVTFTSLYNPHVSKTEIIEIRCEHAFGGWTSKGGEQHVRTCGVCDLTEAEVHQWDEGVLDREGEQAVLRYTCSVCGEIAEKEVSALGDLTGDGKINATDYLLLKRYVLGTFGLSEVQKALADINGDGKINSVDYMLLKRAVLGTYTIA